MMGWVEGRFCGWWTEQRDGYIVVYVLDHRSERSGRGRVVWMQLDDDRKRSRLLKLRDILLFSPFGGVVVWILAGQFVV